MRPITVDPPPFFNRGPSPLARLAFFGVLSLALLFADTRYRYLEDVRQAVAIVLYPLQRALRDARRGVRVRRRLFRRQARAGGRERDAPAGARRAARRRRRAIAREQGENARLRALLDVRTQYAATAIAVEVLYTGRDPFTQKVFVDKGTSAGVQAGAGGDRRTGVVGQVTRVFPVHGRSHAGHRQGPGGAGAGRAQRRAQRALRQRHRAARPSCASWRRRRIFASATASSRPASTAPIRRDWPSRRSSTSSATPARCSRASRASRWRASIAASYLLVLGASGGAAAAAGGARRGRRAEKGRTRARTARMRRRRGRAMRVLRPRRLVRTGGAGGDPAAGQAVVRAAVRCSSGCSRTSRP